MEERKIKYKTILETCAQICGIVTGVFSVIFAGYQIAINNKLEKETRMSNQPIFQVKYDYRLSESGEMFDYTDVKFECHGELTRMIKTPVVTSFLKFEYTDDVYRDTLRTFYIPIRSFFGMIIKTNSISGEIASSHTYLPNNGYYNLLYNEIPNVIVKPADAFVQLIHISKIDYIDKYNANQTIYFINETKAEEQEVDVILHYSKEQFEYKMWSIDKLSTVKLLEICGISDAKN